MKKIMILGAGIYQVPLILKAKELGIYTIVVSIKGNYPGFKFADKSYFLDTRDYEGILEVASNEEIDGIITTGTDVAVKAIGYVNDKLGLTGISYEAAKLSTDKALMKEAFVKGGVKTSKYSKIDKIGDALEFFSSANTPIMLKPVDSSGSRGVTKISTINEIHEIYNQVKHYSKTNYLIAEEFISGYEIGVDLFVYNGEVVLNAVHGKLTYNNGLTDVPIGHYFPLEMSVELKTNLEKECKNVVKAVGYNNCAVNMDVMISNDDVYIIESSGRCGATCIPELVGKYYGFNYYEKMIRVSMGEAVSFAFDELTPCIGKLIISEKDGIIIKQNKISVDNCTDVQFDYKVGDKVRKFSVGPDRLGHIIRSGNIINDYSEIELSIE